MNRAMDALIRERRRFYQTQFGEGIRSTQVGELAANREYVIGAINGWPLAPLSKLLSIIY